MAAIAMNTTGWLKTTEIYSPRVLEIRSLKWVSWNKPRGQQNYVPSRGSRGESFPCLFQLLVAPGVPWLVAALLQSLKPTSVSVLPSHSFSQCVKSPSASLV